MDYWCLGLISLGSTTADRLWGLNPLKLRKRSSVDGKGDAVSLPHICNYMSFYHFVYFGLKTSFLLANIVKGMSELSNLLD